MNRIPASHTRHIESAELLAREMQQAGLDVQIHTVYQLSVPTGQYGQATRIARLHRGAMIAIARSKQSEES